jgi:predicted alpha/beta-hydrolase family hydrolase
MTIETEGTRSVRIPVPEGDDVSGALIFPEGAFALLVLAHGAGAGMHHPFLSNIAVGLSHRGVATLRYQFPYMTAGRRGPDRPPALLRTVRAAVAVGLELAEGLPVFAGGKSMGGRMTSGAAAEDGWRVAGGDGAWPAPVHGLVFLGFPLHPPGKPSTDRGEHLSRVRTPMLFLQGTRDTFAQLDLLRPVVHALGPPATLHLLDGADHGFSVPKRSGLSQADVQAVLADTTVQWMRVVQGSP